ncbi:probable protein NAP1 isoform X5 [Zingiber officinale]|uniref:probable protein NAP1 isoform X5 n=1 Tax=Zingiber officinale TaxID=94328 RepID=UPI001C4A8BB1|nr:probable protein NAP1 isoform X5 [Zingiber officinale]
MFLYSKLSSLKIYRSCYCFFSINQQSGPQIYSKSKLCSYNQVVLKEHLVLTLFRDEVDYQLYLLPSILEFEKLVKSGRAKQKYADLEYNVAKQVEKMIRHMKK